MRRDPEYIPPLRGLADVPIERASVGAMGLNQEHREFPTKPYVYRGTGVDQLPDYVEEEARKRREKARAEKRRLERAEAHKEWERKQRFSWRKEAERQEEERRAARLEREREELESRRYVSKSWKPRNTPRPAPGWKPMTGADIEELLRELE